MPTTSVSLAAGTAVVFTLPSTGWVLSTAAAAIAFIPNAVGTAVDPEREALLESHRNRQRRFGLLVVESQRFGRAGAGHPLDCTRQ